MSQNQQTSDSVPRRVLVRIVLTLCLLSTSVLGVRVPSYSQAASRILSHAATGGPEVFTSAYSTSPVQKLLNLTPSVVREALLQATRELSVRDRSSSSDGVLQSPSGSSFSGTEDVGQTANVSVSPLCLNHTAQSLFALLARQGWALQMLDAFGKPSPAIGAGNLNWPGAYDYCRQVQAYNTFPPFSGQYCTINAQMTFGQSLAADFPVIMSMGICVPDTCSDMDITILLNETLTLLNVSGLPQTYGTCVNPDKKLDARAIIAILICSIILALMLVGTVLDVLLIQRPKWQAEEMSRLMADSDTDIAEHQPLLQGKPESRVEMPEFGLMAKVFLAFSVYTNGTKLLSTRQASGNLTCIHGVRFLSMTWVVLGHCFAIPLTSAANVGPYLQKLLKRWSFQAILNAVVSVDTFFAMSGLLVAYLSLKEMKKRQGKMNWFLFYFHRFWRLTPAYMLIIMVYVCISPYWGQGPLWPKTIPDRDDCKTQWWTNLLYINNLVGKLGTGMCLEQSWYLANDMQFYILSPLIFIPFYYSWAAGLISSGVFLLVTSITPGVITVQEHYPPSFLPATLAGNSTNVGNLITSFYAKPWNRMGPYVIGMLAGYFLYRTNCQLKINRVVNLCLWAMAAGCALAVVYGLYDACNGHPVSLSVGAFYNAVSKQVWAVCVCWVIVACVTGNGGFVNTILSWPALMPLSRLTYCVYLLHIMMIELYLFNSDTMFYMSDINVVVIFLAVLVLSYMAAAIASLAFEAPMMALEKVVFHPRKKECQEEQKP